MKTRERGIVRDIDKFEIGQYRITVQIHFNKNTGEFFGEYLNNRHSAETVSELKQILDKEIRKSIALPWVSVICVNLQGKSYTFTDVLNNDMHGGETYQRKHERVDADLRVHATRFWMAQRSDGKWMECSIWDSRDYEADGVPRDTEFLATSDRRINARDFYCHGEKDFALPHYRKESFDGGDTYYIPYDENIWQALNVIGDRVGELNKQLRDLVATEKGRKKLQSFASRMLPAPKG